MPYVVDHAGGTLIPPFDRALRADIRNDLRERESDRKRRKQKNKARQRTRNADVEQ